MGCLLLAVLCASCVGGNGSDPLAWDKVCAPSEPPPAPVAVETADQMVIYLDTSLSMPGYVSAQKPSNTVFSRSLRELRNFSTLLKPPLNILVRRVDKGVGEPMNDSYLSLASMEQKHYDGRDTDLAGAIGLFHKGVALGKANGEGVPGKPLPPARFHVLVTDGVQSTNRQPVNSPCATGSDQRCVKSKIFELLDKGWGATVIGMRSEFHGKIYSETKRLRGEPTAVAYDSDDSRPETFRPFYFYIFSPDRAQLEQFVEVLKERLRPLAKGGDGLRELGLTARYASGTAEAEATKGQGAGDALELAAEKRGGPARLTLRVNASTTRRGAAPFTVVVNPSWTPGALDSGSPSELAGRVRWTLTEATPAPTEAAARAPRMRYPEVKIVGQETDEQGRIVLRATAQWPEGTGGLGWRGYKLEGRLNLDRQTPAWVRGWSSENDEMVEAGGKTFELENVLLGLWRNDVLQEQLVTEVCLRVGPQ
ncbi:MAG: hypothetical protein ABW250_02620 [Pyrinomonadaceae bacterium]